MKVRFIARNLAMLFACALGLQAQTDIWSPTSGTWANSGNWSNGVPTSADNVEFNNSLTSSSTVDGSYTITYFTIAGGAGPFVLNGTAGAVLTITSGISSSYGSSSPAAIDVPIAGTGNIWLNGGTGTVTLNPGTGANTYSGSTQVFAGGTLADGEANSFSPNSSLYVGGATPSTVDVNFNETVASLGDVAGGPGSVVIANGATLFMTGGFSSTFSGVISGAGGIEMDNVGTFTLTNANTYTGTTVTGVGTAIQLGSGGTTGSIASTSVSGAGSLVFNRSNTLAYSGNLTGALNVVQQGTGTTVLSGVNTYTGPTTLNGGVLQAGSQTALGSGSAFTLNNGTLALNGFNNEIGSLTGAPGTSVTLGSGILTVDNALVNPTSYNGVISGTGSLTFVGNVLELTNANTYSGTTTINSGTLLADNASGSATGTSGITIGVSGALLLGQADTKGSIDPTVLITDNGALQFFRSDAITIPNNITGIGGIDMDGSGSVTLSGNNTYSGTTNIQNAGTLLAGSTTAFGGSIGLSPLTFVNNGTLNLNGFSNTVGSVNGSGASFIQLGSSTLTVGAGTGNYAGTISGTGGSMVFSGISQILTGANTYTGGTTITNGTLLVANTTGSGTGSGPISISPGALLAIGANGTAGSVAAAAIVNNGTINFSRTDNTTIGSSISGNGGITLVATGTVTLTGINSFTGNTIVNAGTLTDGASNAFSPLSNVQVSSGANLVVNNAETVGNLSNGTGSGNVSIGSGVSLTSLGASYVNDFAGNISGLGEFTLANGVQGLSGNNSYQGGTLITANSEIFVGSNTAFGTGTVTFAGSETELSPDATVTLANAFILDSVLDNDDGGNNGLTLSGQISGTSEIEWCTSGVLTLLNASNNFQGGVDMREGTLLLGANTAAGTGSITLDNGTILSAFGSGATLAVPNDLNITGSTQIGNFDNNFITLSGNLSGEVNSVTYSGGTNGTLTLTGANNGLSLDSGFIINSGTVIAGSNTAFGSSGNFVVLNGGVGLNVMHGISINNPLSLSGSANVISGNGSIGSAVTIDNTLVVEPSASPGNGPGTLSFNNSLTLANGGTISFKLYDANGTPGTGFSLIAANSGLNITAGPGSVTLNLFSTDVNGNPAAAINFNPGSSYSWAFVLATPSILGFNSNQFNLNTAGFTNGTGGGTFSVTGNTNELMLNFTPVPEPSTWALIASGLVVLVPFALRRRRMSRA